MRMCNGAGKESIMVMNMVICIHYPWTTVSAIKLKGSIVAKVLLAQHIFS